MRAGTGTRWWPWGRPSSAGRSRSAPLGGNAHATASAEQSKTHQPTRSPDPGKRRWASEGADAAGVFDRRIRPIPAQGSPDARIAALSLDDSRSGASREQGCVNSCEHPVPAPRQPALSCGPVVGSARSPPHGRRPATGSRCPAEADAWTAEIPPCAPATPPRCGCRGAGRGPMALTLLRGRINLLGQGGIEACPAGCSRGF